MTLPIIHSPLLMTCLFKSLVPLSGLDCFPVAQLKISLQTLNPHVNLASIFFQLVACVCILPILFILNYLTLASWLSYF